MLVKPLQPDRVREARRGRAPSSAARRDSRIERRGASPPSTSAPIPSRLARRRRRDGGPTAGARSIRPSGSPGSGKGRRAQGACSRSRCGAPPPRSREFARAARGLGATRVRIVATSAVREAGNRAGVSWRAWRAESGEPGGGRLGRGRGAPDAPGSHVRAARPRRLRSCSSTSVGAAPEFVLARGGGAAAAVSLRLGVVPLVEEWGEPGPVRWDRFARMREAVELPPGRRGAGYHRGGGDDEAGRHRGAPSPRWPALDLGLPPTTRLGSTATGSAARRWSRSWPGWARSPSPTVDGCRASSRGRADVIIPGIAICLARDGALPARARRGERSRAPRRHSLRAAGDHAVTRPSARTLSVIDYHTEGEPMRFIVDGVPRAPRRARSWSRASTWPRTGRDLLGMALYEPRGTPLCGGDPDRSGDAGGRRRRPLHRAARPGAHVRARGRHRAGRHAGGDGAEFGRAGGAATVTLDTPAGLVSCRVASRAGAADLGHDPQRARAFSVGLDLHVEVPGLGRVVFDLAYGGHFYALVGGGGVRPRLERERGGPDSWRWASGSVSPVGARVPLVHPAMPEARGAASTCQFHEPARRADAQAAQRGGGARPPASTARPAGTGDLRAARQPPRARPARGRGGRSAHESIIGTLFTGRIAALTDVAGTRRWSPRSPDGPG